MAIKVISLRALDESLNLASILEMFLWELPRTDWVDPSVGVGVAVSGWHHSLWLQLSQFYDR